MEKDIVVISRAEYDNLMDMKRIMQDVSDKGDAIIISFIELSIGKNLYQRDMVAYPKNQLLLEYTMAVEHLRQQICHLKDGMTKFKYMGWSEFKNWQRANK